MLDIVHVSFIVCYQWATKPASSFQADCYHSNALADVCSLLDNLDERSRFVTVFSSKYHKYYIVFVGRFFLEGKTKNFLV